MLSPGLVGYVLRKAEFPLAPIILGIILGPLAEENLDRVMTLAQAHDMSVIGYFFDRRITIGLMVLTFAAIGFSFLRDVKLRRGEKISAIPEEEE